MTAQKAKNLFPVLERDTLVEENGTARIEVVASEREAVKGDDAVGRVVDDPFDDLQRECERHGGCVRGR